MQRNGIVAAGDISNNDLSFEIKAQSKIKYHTFIEVYDINNNTDETMAHAGRLKKKADGLKLSSSIIPHAPYTVSEILYNILEESGKYENSIFSTHNQECEDENKLYIDNSGIFREMGIVPFDFSPKGKNSLQALAYHFKTWNKKLLVHNTFAKREDILFASDNLSDLFWVMCPAANQYIENRLPPIYEFMSLNQDIAIGTDSLASNNSLSILKEIKIISENFPSVPLEMLVKWSTYYGAKALGMDNKLGSFEPGKKPGINLIDMIDFREMKLTEGSSVTVLV